MRVGVHSAGVSLGVQMLSWWAGTPLDSMILTAWSIFRCYLELGFWLRARVSRYSVSFVAICLFQCRVLSTTNSNCLTDALKYESIYYYAHCGYLQPPRCDGGHSRRELFRSKLQNFYLAEKSDTLKGPLAIGSESALRCVWAEVARRELGSHLPRLQKYLIYGLWDKFC